MFICPTCSKEFNTEEMIQKHFLSCWKEQHPYHQGKSAPRGTDVETREVSSEIADFFERINNGRSFN